MDKETWRYLLRDGRWIELRNKVFERDGCKCVLCGSPHDLQAHHRYYSGKDRRPWEYPISSLSTLCDNCHHSEHAIRFSKHEYHDEIMQCNMDKHIMLDMFNAFSKLTPEVVNKIAFGLSELNEKQARVLADKVDEIDMNSVKENNFFSYLIGAVENNNPYTRI